MYKPRVTFRYVDAGEGYVSYPGPGATNYSGNDDDDSPQRFNAAFRVSHFNTAPDVRAYVPRP